MGNRAKEIKRENALSSKDFWGDHPLFKEFSRDQLPMILGVFVLGIIASYLQHGYLAGGDAPFTVARVRVPIWHLLWMGF